MWEPLSAMGIGLEYRWTVGYNGGFSTQVLELAWKGDDITLEQAAQMGIHNWRTLIAPLTSNDARLELQETSLLVSPFVRRLDVPPNSTGLVPDPQCDPSKVPVWVTHTVDTDDWARRPLYFPGTPAKWVSDGRLNRAGCNAHLTLCRAAAVGFGQCWLPGVWQAIRFHSGFGDDRPDAPKVPSFRKVLHWRVCTHLDRPPQGAI